MARARLVLLTRPRPLFPVDVDPAALAGLDVEVVRHACTEAAEAAAAVRGADVVLVAGHRVDAALVAAMDRARAVCLFSHGFESVDVEAATAAGIVVCNAARICHLEVANHAAGLLLCLNRRIVQYDRALRRGVWDRPAGRPIGPLDGETAGLIGLGAIGQALARRLAPFGLRLIAHDPGVEPWIPRELGVELVPDLPALLARADYVSIQVPDNRQTRRLMGEAEFRAMKPTAYFVNCCRGAVVDEAALTRALEAGWIAGAGLDVFEREPTDPANPLLRMEGVVATPHAAGESTRSAPEAVRVASRQAAAVLRGHWPDRAVNPEVLPRLRAPLAGVQ